MNSKKLDIVLETGIDFRMPFTLYDNNGNIIDLSGATVDAQLRQYEESTDYFPFEVTHNGKGGRILMSMSHDLTAKIPYTTGVYDVRVTFSDGFIAKPMEGEVAIVPSATR